jgi:hypothetical protein
MAKENKKFDLIFNIKGNKVIKSREDIKLNLKVLGQRGVEYACLCQLHAPEAPFIQAVMVTPRRYQVEYKNDLGMLWETQRKDFSKAEIIDLFIDYYESNADWMNDLQWVHLAGKDAAQIDINLKQEDHTLDLGHKQGYGIVNYKHLEELLNHLGTPGTNFAVLSLKKGGEFLQTNGDDKAGYILEYTDNKGILHHLEETFPRHTIIEFFLRYYQGERKWLKQYKSEILEFESYRDEDENEVLSPLGIFIFVLSIIVAYLSVNYMGSTIAYGYVGFYCVYSLFFYTERTPNLNSFLFALSGAYCCAMESQGPYLFGALFLCVGIRTVGSFFRKGKSGRF